MWQLEPAIWNHVRRAVDDRGDTGQFILAGSSQPMDDETRHTGAGRISRLRMRPMSLSELGVSNGAISLADLLKGQSAEVGDPGLEFEDLAATICRGGWPGFRELDLADAQRRVRDYLNEIPRDTQRLGNGHRPERVSRLLQSLARNVATSAAATVLSADASRPEDSVSDDAVAAYLSALTRLFVVEDQPAGSRICARGIASVVQPRDTSSTLFGCSGTAGWPRGIGPRRQLQGLLFESRS